jgi:hypothetical protein
VLSCSLAAVSAAAAFHPPGKEVLKRIHLEGRGEFYRGLEGRCRRFATDPGDLQLLLAAEHKLPDLYDRLMNFYFWLYDWEGLDAENFRERYLAVSSRMALDLLASLPPVPPRPEFSPLETVLRSAGCEASAMVPQFRSLLRRMNPRVSSQWVLDELGLDRVHRRSRGERARIAVIDTGLDPSIRELRFRARITKNLLDTRPPLSGKGRYPYDLDGHGTSVASVINRIAPAAELMIIKFYDRGSMQDFPSTRWTGYLLAAALRWAALHGADVINLSATVREDATQVRNAVRFCWERNIPVITPMGNVFHDQDKDRIVYPACYPWTIAVGGVEKNRGGLQVRPFSSKGDYVDVAAPAMGLRVAVPNYRGRRRTSNLAYGTSFAAAIVSGAAGLVLSGMDPEARKDLKSLPGGLCEAVRDVLRKSASVAGLDCSIPSPGVGYGLIDIARALDLTGVLTSSFGRLIMRRGYEKIHRSRGDSDSCGFDLRPASSRGIDRHQRGSAGSGF